MPRPKKTETYLLKKKADLQAEIDRLLEERRKNERAIEADLRKQQLAWEAKVGRLAWLAGLYEVDFETLAAFFQEFGESERLCGAGVSLHPTNGVSVDVS